MNVGETANLEPYDGPEHQQEAVVFGMWIFLAAELIFFGGLILGFTEFRLSYPAGFGLASNRTNLYLGTLNTGVLLSSSLSMALGLQAGSRRKTRAFLALTLLLGLVFLGIKCYEYTLDIHEQLLPGPRFRFPGPESAHAQLFFLFYFTMTAIHAIHLGVGIGLLCFLLIGPLRKTTTHAVGLYWHFVDIVWVFLFPLLYLLGRHHV